MEQRFKDLRELVLWLADTYHKREGRTKGSVYPMGKQTGLSPALVDKWSKGVVKNPTSQSIQMLCDAYNLEYDYVRALADNRPPRGRLFRRKLAAIAFAMLSIAWVPAEAGTPNASQVIDNLRLIGSSKRRLWPAFCPA